jgi:ATP/maltotriose-dependent transcriptional regulator MalT
MRQVTLRGLLAHKMRLALTALAIVLGVTFISGTFVLTDTLNSTFSTLFTSVYSKIDFQVRGVPQFGSGSSATRNPLPESLLSRVRAVPEPELLSHRELEVLGLVAAGTTNRETAARLFISEATVKTHLLHVYAKLGVTDRAATVGEAFNRGLLTPGKTERH